MPLKKVIEQLYSTFSIYQPPKNIIRFNCISCMSQKDEEYLLSTSLRELSDHIFGCIMEACNTIPMGHACYKYFIPRILELTTSKNLDFSFSFVEHVYRDFAKFDYQNTFKREEKLAVDNFFYAFLESEFSRPKDDRDEAELFNVAKAGCDTIPFIEQVVTQMDQSDIKQELNQHIALQRKWAASEEEFKLWVNTGTIKSLITYLTGEYTP